MDEGAAVIAGGHGRPDGVDEHGYYVRPTVFSRASNRMTIAQDEIFGPVAVLLSYDTERDAIDIANDTPYGLSGAVWAATDERAAAVAAQIDAGQVLLNGARSPGVTPFGGVKQSGYGREGGRFGVEEYLVYKALHRLPVSAR
jgi:acyl-CoA reductase-like NAD-dependent aldehyde dehydrogenase